MTASSAGPTIEVVPEKPVAGGRMLARHAGQVLLVRGALPGESVRVRLEGRARGVTFGQVVEVLQAHPGRRDPPVDSTCGGNMLAHATYPTQLALKAGIVADAFRRIAGHALEDAVPVEPSPETGYRMRARLHLHADGVGFHRAGSHQICDARASGQLRAEAMDAVEALSEVLRSSDPGVGRARLSSLLLAENVGGDGRVVHLDGAGRTDQSWGRLAARLAVAGLSGVSGHGSSRGEVWPIVGDPWVRDRCPVRVEGRPAASVVLQRRAPSFFQGNRYLLATLVDRVVRQVTTGAVLDLYAGVGLFGLALAAARGDAVTAVEGDLVAAADLSENARPFGTACIVHPVSVEEFLSGLQVWPWQTVVVDPPRTGLSRRAVHSLAGWKPPRLVYVSCDVVTLARDVRTFLDRGYELVHLEALDLFPNTAHVETIAVLERRE